MTSPLRRMKSLDDLGAFVAKTLCEHGQLEPDTYPLFQRVLHRGAKPCGIQFCVAGPKSLRLTAIWDAERRRLLFYDSEGERFRTVDLRHTSLKAPARQRAA